MFCLVCFDVSSVGMAGVNGVEEAVFQTARTFVFLDIETTGLPCYNFGKANITELAMWTSSRNDFLPTESGLKRRLLNKWSMVFNPAMMIHPDATKITGLDNEMLEEYNKFDANAGQALISYLSHYPKPICLVAHNGINFDFPIIKKSLEKIDLTMPDYIFCSDSIQVIKKLDTVEEERRLAREEGKKNNIASGEDGTVQELSNEHSSDSCTTTELTDNVENDLFNATNSALKERQKLNETTPKKGCKTKYNRKNALISDDVGKQSDGINKSCKARKELFPSTLNTCGKVTKPQKKSYRLGAIYERIFNCKPEVAHAAEADVEALYRIAAKYGDEFIDVADQMAIPFSQIKTNGLR